jgi:hypothetical protein
MPITNNEVKQLSRSSYILVDKNGVSGPSTSLGDSVSFNTLLYVDSKNLPNFGKLKKREIAVNPQLYTKSTLYHRDSIGSLTARARILTPGVDFGKVQRTEYTINYKTAWPTSQSMPASRVDDLDQQVISELYRKLSTTKSDTAVSLAEGGKTAAHVAKTATRIYEAIRALKSFRFGDFARAIGLTQVDRHAISYGRKKRKLITVLKDDGSKDPKIISAHPQLERYTDQKVLHVFRDSSRVSDFIADTWLEYSYAWKPLLNDVYNQAEALATHLIERSNVLRRENARRKVTQVDNVKYSPPGNTIWTEESKRVIEYWVEYIVFFRIPNGSPNPLNTFGINNPLVVAWELVPFSFVADWFIPIGSFLSSLTALNGLEFASGTVSKRKKVTLTNNFLGNGTQMVQGSYQLSATGQVGAVTETFEFTRRLLATFPSVCFPRFKDPRSFAHAASAIALLQSIFLRGNSK